MKGNSFFKLSDIEVKRGGISYSIDTIKSIEKKFEELYYLIGVDAFSEIDTWHRYGSFLSYEFYRHGKTQAYKGTGLRIFPSDVRKQIKVLNDRTFEHTSGKRVHLQLITQLDISATRIRFSMMRKIDSISGSFTGGELY